MKNYLSLLILLISAALISCENEDVTPGSPITGNPSTPDSAKPSINLATPDDNSNLIVIENLVIRAVITDNGGLKVAKVSLVDANGASVLPHGDYVFTYFARYNSLNFSIYHRFSLGIETGAYKIIIEAEDKQQNVATYSVNIHLSAPDINEAEFSNIFTNNGYVASYLSPWDYSPLTESVLSAGFVYVLDRDRDNKILKAEWEKFVADFGISKQNWSAWDVNNDGYLTEEEFSHGFSETKLFDEWDKSKDAILSEEEFASGVFGIWDSNKNGKLSRLEYEEKVHAYFN